MADLAGVMSNASICGLGHTAATALASALQAGLLDKAFERIDLARASDGDGLNETNRMEESR
ncbi:MAG: hypothetical protein H0X18_11290 [Geodermatophilaceae bacterium]|nr:hypothetical protein [Geodermatophilaceae bacterium]